MVFFNTPSGYNPTLVGSKTLREGIQGGWAKGVWIKAAGKFTQQPENPKRPHFRALALQTSKFNEKTPKRGKKENCGGRGEKTREILSLPPFGATGQQKQNQTKTILCVFCLVLFSCSFFPFIVSLFCLVFPLSWLVFPCLSLYSLLFFMILFSCFSEFFRPFFFLFSDVQNLIFCGSQFVVVSHNILHKENQFFGLLWGVPFWSVSSFIFLCFFFFVILLFFPSFFLVAKGMKEGTVVARAALRDMVSDALIPSVDGMVVSGSCQCLDYVNDTLAPRPGGECCWSKLIFAKRRHYAQPQELSHRARDTLSCEQQMGVLGVV